MVFQYANPLHIPTTTEALADNFCSRAANSAKSPCRQLKLKRGGHVLELLAICDMNFLGTFSRWLFLGRQTGFCICVLGGEIPGSARMDLTATLVIYGDIGFCGLASTSERWGVIHLNSALLRPPPGQFWKVNSRVISPAICFTSGWAAGLWKVHVPPNKVGVAATRPSACQQCSSKDNSNNNSVDRKNRPMRNCGHLSCSLPGPNRRNPPTSVSTFREQRSRMAGAQGQPWEIKPRWGASG